MDTTIQKACVWGALPMGLLFGGGFLIAGFLPPIEPSLSADEVAAIYRDHGFNIRVGMIVSMAAIIPMLLFYRVISEQLQRIPDIGGILPGVQMHAGGTAQAIFATIYFVMFITATYRPDRNPEITQFINDFAWLGFVGTYNFVVVQSIVIAWAVLSDKSDMPIFPRWFGYFNLWVAVIDVVDIVISFFKSGPLAWDGLITFYLVFLIFGIWIAVTMGVLLKAINSGD